MHNQFLFSCTILYFTYLFLHLPMAPLSIKKHDCVIRVCLFVFEFITPKNALKKIQYKIDSWLSLFFSDVQLEDAIKWRFNCCELIAGCCDPLPVSPLFVFPKAQRTILSAPNYKLKPFMCILKIITLNLFCVSLYFMHVLFACLLGVFETTQRCAIGSRLEFPLIYNLYAFTQAHA